MKNKILILEDEKDTARLYAKRLKENGYEPALAFDGLEGLNKIKENEPDLILLDLNMPHMGGLEFYRHICDPQAVPKYPVLILTGRADLESLFSNFHIDGFIIKPFEASRLLNEIETILHKKYWKEIDSSLKKVFIVDNDMGSAEKIRTAFSYAGFKTDTAANGVAGIEKMMADPPDLALVKLGLDDISGDLVILRLQQIARTKKTRSLLYVPKGHDIDKIILDKIAHKSGVSRLLEYNDPLELINAANKIFTELEPQTP